MTAPRFEARAVTGSARHLPAWAVATLQYLRRNPSLVIGLLLLGGLALFSSLGRLFWDTATAAPLSAAPAQPPGGTTPWGSDPQGRDVLAVMILGTWLTIRTGLIAGGLGIVFGSALGLFSGYVGGRTDMIITWLVDVLLTVPAILFLVMIAAVVQTGLSSFGMALIVATLAWRRPARQVRSQMLVLRKAGYVEMARLSGPVRCASSSPRSCRTCCPFSCLPSSRPCPRRSSPASGWRPWVSARRTSLRSA